MRLPNGYGTIYKLSGNRRRPWVVKKSISGKQKAIGYFKTHEEALSFLVDYNRRPQENPTTFGAIYFQWKSIHFAKISKSSQSGYDISFRHLQSIHQIPIQQLAYPVLQNAMDKVRQIAGYPTQKKCRVLISQVLQHAMKCGLISENISKLIEIDRNVIKFKKKPFIRREINRLKNEPDILILIYTGMRIGEYLSLTPKDVNLRQRYIDIRKSKTKAGIRKIPIHPLLLEWLIARKKSGVICPFKNYDSYRRYFDKAMVQHNMHHTPHECRHTFASMLDSAGINDTVCRMLLGHARQGVTKAVYTHKSLRELRKAINKLK